MGCWTEMFFKCYGSHDQDVFQAHIWKKKNIQKSPLEPRDR